MKSPKGNYRLVELGMTGSFFLIVVALSGGFDAYGNWYLEKALNPSGWVFKQLNNIVEICIGLVFLYIGHRLINHLRTHELLANSMKSEKIAVTATWIVAIAYVVGNAIR